MNLEKEMQNYLDDAKRTIIVTRNTLNLVNEQSGDVGEIKREAMHNIEYIEKDLKIVKRFLNPERYATRH